MAYQVKEIFYTLQGEGFHAGRAAVFCRFAGCNLWSGREQDRSSAACTFCDTDFIGTNGELGGRYQTALDLVDVVNELWPKHNDAQKFIVLTGGEPLLQLDQALIETLHAYGFFIAIETNGTLAVPDGIDWICVSPKYGTTLVQHFGNELKVVTPQSNDDTWLQELSILNFHHFFLQPMDGNSLLNNTKIAINWCLQHPIWQLSIQLHKIIGVK